MKIDGNLIIHSFLASEKAMASRRASDTNKARETGLAIPRDLSPALTVRNIRALTSGSEDHIKATAADGKLQQWFREGLAGNAQHTNFF